MKASQIKTVLESYSSIGSFEKIKEGTLLAISWDDEDCDGNIDAHCEWVSLDDI